MADTDKTSGLGGSDAIGIPDFDFNKARQNLDSYSNQIIATFTQGRERVTEFQRAIADTLPGVRRLGGDIGSVTKVITEVAEASRRNVVASGEQIEDLFTASRVLGISVKELSDSFLSVGISIDSVSESLEESVEYIQSIGGNARQVMKDVEDNMAQINRFQFEGGVQGLTKMAAQASMLRFSMKETFQLAERVLTPEGAIETAGAFQRLGVAAGNLVDPFQLMNMSINDPSGLQDSLVDIAKQFTEFDEKTKTFKINPQGVLTLKAIQDQTGVSAEEMSKLGLAASELDRRLSMINPEVTFVNEEDKQYLSNIANLQGGEYIVKVKNDLGDQIDRKLSEITQDELNKLIDEQKNQPKTLEDVARAQLTLDEQVANDIAAIRYTIMGGILTDKNVQNIIEGSREVADAVLRGGGEKITTGDVRGISETLTGTLEQVVLDTIKAGKFEDITKNIGETVTKNLGTVGEKSLGLIEGAAGEIMEKLKDTRFGSGLDSLGIESILQNLSGNLVNLNIPTTTSSTSPTTNTPITVDGIPTANQNLPNMADRFSGQKSIVELLGGLKIDVNFQDLPTGLSDLQKEQITKEFSKSLNEDRFKNYILNITKVENVYGGGGMPTY
jgi:hypothetical protein